jgi:hypothetical protein
MSGKRYGKEEVALWAKEYMSCGSIKEVAKKFDAGADTVSKRLHECKEKLGLVFPFEDDELLFSECKMRCSGKCGLVKLLVEFYHEESGRIAHICIECKRKHQREYGASHKEEELERSYNWAKNNREKSRQIKADWVKNNPEKVKASTKKSNAKQAPKQKIWREENKDRTNAQAIERRKTDVNFKIACNLRSRISTAVRKGFKSGSAVRDLGCSIEELKSYFIPMFYMNPETGEIMSWDNYGEWHIDHIKPLISFDLTDREQCLKACHYTNLQPLWAKENIAKGGRIIEEQSDVIY